MNHLMNLVEDALVIYFRRKEKNLNENLKLGLVHNRRLCHIGIGHCRRGLSAENGTA